MQNTLTPHPRAQSLIALRHQLKLQDPIVKLGPGVPETPQAQPLEYASP